MKIIINTCFGGFGLSEVAYERLIELGIPVQAYVEQERDEDGLYKPQPKNDGRVIFDRNLAESPDKLNDSMRTLCGRYWTSWNDNDTRVDPLVIQVVEELGDKANGRCASLEIIEIPDGIEWEISEYDGIEHVAETHRRWP